MNKASYWPDEAGLGAAAFFPGYSSEQYKKYEKKRKKSKIEKNRQHLQHFVDAKTLF